MSHQYDCRVCGAEDCCELTSFQFLSPKKGRIGLDIYECNKCKKRYVVDDVIGQYRVVSGTTKELMNSFFESLLNDYKEEMSPF